MTQEQWRDGFASRDAEVLKLHAEIERLRAALLEISDSDWNSSEDRNVLIARAALKDTKP